jgi:fatty-acyl-CoA synthase
MSMLYYKFLFRYLGLLAFKRHTLGKTVEQMAARQGNTPFLLFENEQVTFDEFNRASNRRANLMMALGVQKGEVIALMMENRPEILTTLVGLSKLGAVTSAINTNLTGQALAHSLNICGATRLIVGAECLERLVDILPNLERIRSQNVFLDTRWPATVPLPGGLQDLNGMLTGASEADPPPVPLRSSDLLMFIYTSGTTGLPKAARITHLRWFTGALALGYYAWEVTPQDTVYCALPLYHSNGAIIAFGAALVNGAKLGISRRFRASKFWEEVVQFKATCFIYIGELLRYLVNTPPTSHDRAHKVDRILGNGLRPDIWKQFQERFAVPHIREFYASTEGNAGMVNLADVPGSCGTPILKTSNNLALVGYNVDSNEYIRDGNGFCTRCAPGEIGELLGQIKATTPFQGYSNAAETEKKLLRNVFKKGDVYFKTGDLLKQDAAGHYYFVDRIGDTYRWKGENVSTQEVQELLTSYPGIHMINVFGVSIPGAEGRAGMAVMLMEENAKFDPAAFFKHTQDHLPSYARPAFVRLAKDMFLTGTFKLRKVELQKAGFDPAGAEGPVYYRDESKAAYMPLTPALHEDIKAGRVRF